MTVLPIRRYGDEVLRIATAPVTEFGSALDPLIRNMTETMLAAPGIGLAANQVGVSTDLMIIDLSVGRRPGELLVFANARIVERQGEQFEDEGCLSVPDFLETVTRPLRVKIQFQDRTGDERSMWGEGLMARAMCHETDHLRGGLFIDHLRGFKREKIIKKISKLSKSGMW